MRKFLKELGNKFLCLVIGCLVGFVIRRMEMTKRREAQDDDIVRHHIVPRSKGGRNKTNNICKLLHSRHVTYHALFGNRTPEQIIKYLVTYFWGGQWEFVKKALEVHDEGETKKKP